MKTLPVLAAFSHAFHSTTNNLGFAFQISWPWMLALLPINIAGNIYVLANGFVSVEAMSSGVFAVSLVMVVASMLAFSSIAVNWHRYILLDEVPHGMERLRLDSTVWRYVGNLILIWLAVVLIYIGGAIGFVVTGLAMYATAGEGSLWLLALAAIPFVCALIVIAYRLSVKLPAVALGRQDYGMRNAWNDTTGNSWKFLGLFLLYFLVIIVAGLLAGAVGWILGQIGGNAGQAISVAVQLAVNWVLTILGVTMLTSLYGFFVENREF